jgi:hypothetical protein
MRLRWPGITLALLVVAGVCGACSTTTTARRASPFPTVSVPQGWRTYAYGKAVIAVPSDWTVSSDGCGDSTSPGTLLLGMPKVRPSCPMDQNGQNEVELISPSSPVGPSKDSTVVNGLRVYPIPTGSPDGQTGIGWSIPELGVDAFGAGVIGSTVLHTLHEVSSDF